MPEFEKTKPFMASSEDGPYAILGVPFDMTTTYRPGTRFAPSAIREASYGLEEYDILGNRDLRDIKFFDRGDLIILASPERAINEIKEAIISLVKDDIKPIILGGEHLISYPVVELLSRNKDLYVIILDAHADMRDEYNGLRLSHATTARRISEVVPQDRLFQFGIRSGSREEAEYYMDTNIFHSFEPPDDGFFNFMKGKEVYLSIDIDVVDPAFAPGTGTPEPCGWSSQDVISFIKKLKGIRLAGADVVEVSPLLDPSGITSILAARIVREILLYLTEI